MHIRCPHCQQPIEVVHNDLMAEIDCPSCGSSFGLAGDAASGTILAHEPSSMDTRSYQDASRKTIAHFTLINELGVGAFGSVYKAIDTKLDRTVAVKIPRRDQLTPDETEQFLREARAAAQLAHQNIVTVHEVGRHEDGTVYIVSDFVEGASLADWLTGQSMSSREAAELCATLADALHHAHERGVVHRDLKPANVLMDTDLQPHIADFGLAKRDAGEITMTLEGRILGTPAYMAPEQAQGDAHSADRRADVYSLGVILFEILTGERPFRGNTRMLIHQVLTEEAPSPRQFNATIPRDLETICLKCLEKKPEDRFETAAELARELHRWLNGEAIRSRPISRIERGWRWCQRKPVVAGLSTSLLVSLVAGLMTVSFFWLKSEESRIQAEESRSQVEETNQELVRSNRETQQANQQANASLYESLLSQAKAVLSARELGFQKKVWDLLSRSTKLDSVTPDYDRIRNLAVASLGDFRGREPVTFSVKSSGAPTGAFLDDNHVAVRIGGSVVSIRRIDSGEEDRVVPGRYLPGAPTDPYVPTLEHTVPLDHGFATCLNTERTVRAGARG